MAKIYGQSGERRHDRVKKREGHVLEKRYQALLRQGYEPEEAMKRVAEEKHRDVRTVRRYVGQTETVLVAPSTKAEDVSFEFDVWKKNQELQEAIEALLNNLDSADNNFRFSGFDMEGWDKGKKRLDGQLRDFLLPRTRNARSEAEASALHALFNIVDVEAVALFNEYYLRWPELNPLREAQTAYNNNDFIESLQAWIIPSCKVPPNLRPGPCREGKQLCPLLDAERRNDDAEGPF